MQIDLDELERTALVAKQASPGRWASYPYTDHYASIHAGNPNPGGLAPHDGPGTKVSQSSQIQFADHIVAVQPDVTLALVARIRELEAGLRDACRGMCFSEPHTEGEARSDAALHDRCMAILEQGAVLP